MNNIPSVELVLEELKNAENLSAKTDGMLEKILNDILELGIDVKNEDDAKKRISEIDIELDTIQKEYDALINE